MSITGYTLKSVDFASFHSVMKNGIILVVINVTSKKILTLQNKFVGLIAGIKPRYSCSILFKRLDSLALPREYILMNLPLVFRRVHIMLAVFSNLLSTLTSLINKKTQFKGALDFTLCESGVI